MKTISNILKQLAIIIIFPALSIGSAWFIDLITKSYEANTTPFFVILSVVFLAFICGFSFFATFILSAANWIE